jgi:hypothetical protein
MVLTIYTAGMKGFEHLRGDIPAIKIIKEAATRW